MAILTSYHVPSCAAYICFPVALDHWTSGRVLDQSTHCYTHCLSSATLVSAPVIDEPLLDLNSVPADCYDLGTVFSKAYDCAIDLLPEAVVEHILPSSIMVRALCLDIKKRVQKATSNLPVPDGCWGRKLFMPDHLFCHPGAPRT
ncbi:hypothetical protein QTP70_019869 [Hemibagrus guttatus]|uniref:Uncharacterized protein n=1 Tax=Hemibagrus guttatus TaxID=175788 RepID=A0AAE0PRU9_9TELE|nr:hypothetical protein QTP70_019869 [Hemibagrus guttatus]